MRERQVRGSGTVPRQTATAVPARRRLLSRLDRRPRLAVVRAPLGWGKTELVVTWLESLRSDVRQVIRIPGPAGIGDAESYWRTVLDGIRASGVIAGEQVPSVPSSSAAEEVREYLTHRGTPTLLVLADADRVDDDRVESDIVDLLTRCRDVDVVVTACRPSPFADPFPADPAHELIDADDLLYTREEMEDLFAHAEIGLGPGELDYIRERVGSIPALVRIAAAGAKNLPTRSDRRELLAHRIDAALDRFVQSTILTHPSVADPDFVVTVATARVVTVETTALLTRIDHAAQQLSSLEAAGIVKRCEMAPHESWEFAPPVRERLLALQDQTVSAERLTLLSRHESEQGHVAEALTYAGEARNWDLVTDLIDRHWVSLVSSHFRLLRETLSALPADLLDARPTIKVGRDLFSLLGAQPTVPIDALPSEPRALEQLGASEEGANALSIGCVQSLMMRLAGEHGRAAELTRRLNHLVRGALATRPDDIVPQLPIMRVQWGITYQLAGALAESTTELRLGYHGGLAEGGGFIARNAAANAAMNWAIIGDPQRTEEWLAREDALPRSDDWLESMVKVGGLVARTLVALDRLDFAACRRYLDELGEASEREELWPFVTAAHCRHALATGQAYTGIAILQRAIASHAPILPTDSPVAQGLTSLEVDLRLALGEGNRALSILDPIIPDRSLLAVAAARTHLLTGSPATALTLCRSFDHQLPRMQLEILLIEAAAHHALGANDAAARAWDLASELVDRAELIGTLATVPRKLLRKLEAASSAPSTAVAAFLASDTPEIFPAAAPRVILTERERAVLTELASERSIAEIAEKLFVSTNTVKSQLRSVYRKIGAHSRKEALETAYRSGLLP